MTNTRRYSAYEVDEYIGSCLELEEFYRSAIKNLVNLTGRRTLGSDDVVERQRQIFDSLQERLKSFESSVPSEIRQENRVVNLVSKFNELIKSVTID